MNALSEFEQIALQIEVANLRKQIAEYQKKIDAKICTTESKDGVLKLARVEFEKWQVKKHGARSLTFTQTIIGNAIVRHQPYAEDNWEVYQTAFQAGRDSLTGNDDGVCYRGTIRKSEYENKMIDAAVVKSLATQFELSDLLECEYSNIGRADNLNRFADAIADYQRDIDAKICFEKAYKLKVMDN